MDRATESWIWNLLGFWVLIPQNKIWEDSQSKGKSSTTRALQLYQEVHAMEGSQPKALDAIELFQDNLKAKTFITIADPQLQTQWLHQQINCMNGNR
jgi:hypothetical protein